MTELTLIVLVAALALGVVTLVVLRVIIGPQAWGLPSAPKPSRRSPFAVGRSYRVLQTFRAMRDTFTAGEILVYRSDGYSVYDGVAGYFFDSPPDPTKRAWDVRDDEDLATWKAFFEEVPPSAKSSHRK